jgi:hypothetical protein
VRCFAGPRNRDGGNDEMNVVGSNGWQDGRASNIEINLNLRIVVV